MYNKETLSRRIHCRCRAGIRCHVLKGSRIAAAMVKVTHDSAAAIHAVWLKPPEAERRRIRTPKARRWRIRPPEANDGGSSSP